MLLEYINYSTSSNSSIIVFAIVFEILLLILFICLAIKLISAICKTLESKTILNNTQTRYTQYQLYLQQQNQNINNGQ